MAYIKAFDTNVVQLDRNTSSILKVETKVNKNNNFYGVTSSYRVAGSVLILKRKYAEIKVTYEVFTDTTGLIKENIARTQNDPRMPRSELHKKMEEIVESPELQRLKQRANEVNEKFAAQEAVSFKDLFQEIQGFQALSEPLLENMKSTFDTIPVINSSNATGAAKTASETSNSDLITGKSTKSGAPNKIVTLGNPVAINSVYQVDEGDPILEATPTQIKNILKGTSIKEDAVDNANIKVKPADTASLEITKAIKATFNKFESAPIQTKETSYANLLPNLVGQIKSLKPAAFDEVLPGIKTDLPDLIDKFKQTGLTENTVGGIWSDPKTKMPLTSLITKLGGELNDFGKSSQVFEVVDTIEELQYELAGIKRDVTACIFHWTKTYANQFLTAYDIDKLHKAQQEFKLGVEDVAKAGNKAGIMWHYCILKDGTLQRGRPIELNTIDSQPFAERAIHVGFVAGYEVDYQSTDAGVAKATKNSITTEQWKTFDLLVSSMIMIKPGIGITGHNTLHHISSCPGFDVEQYIKDKFSYSSPYDQRHFDNPNALTVDEIINLPATEIAKVPKNVKRASLNSDALAEKNTNVNQLNGEKLEVPKEEIDKAIKDFNSKLRELENADIQIKLKEQKANLESFFGDPTRTSLTGDIQNLKLDRTPIIETLDTFRKDLINSGYEFDDVAKTWKKIEV